MCFASVAAMATALSFYPRTTPQLPPDLASDRDAALDAIATVASLRAELAAVTQERDDAVAARDVATAYSAAVADGAHLRHHESIAAERRRVLDENVTLRAEIIALRQRVAGLEELRRAADSPLDVPPAPPSLSDTTVLSPLSAASPVAAVPLCESPAAPSPKELEALRLQCTRLQAALRHRDERIEDLSRLVRAKIHTDI